MVGRRRRLTRRPLGLVLLASTVLCGCTTDSGVRTTPTFSAARYLPPDPSTSATTGGRASGPAPAPTAYRAPTLTGARAIANANKSATVDPDNTTLRGATWFIEDADSTLIYRVRTALGRVTTILLPPGERFNGAVGGDVDNFLINVAYAGPRPAVSILPRAAAATGNLQLVTTGGFYSDLLVNEYVALNLIDVAREPSSMPKAAADTLPQPQGDFTRLTANPVGSETLPAWAPVEEWADSSKMVVRFNGPLPVLPALFAGQEGEQLVSYRSIAGDNQLFLITNRRVTEAELRLGDERVRITVDRDAIGAGMAADPPLVPPAGAMRHHSSRTRSRCCWSRGRRPRVTLASRRPRCPRLPQANSSRSRNRDPSHQPCRRTHRVAGTTRPSLPSGISPRGRSHDPPALTARASAAGDGGPPPSPVKTQET